MSLVLLDEDTERNTSNETEVTKSFINTVDDIKNLAELTNVFRLKVAKAQYHLDHLKASIEKKGNNVNEIKEKVSDDEHNLVRSELKDQLEKFSNTFIIKSVFINPGQLVSVSDVLEVTGNIMLKLEEDRNNVQLEIIKQKSKVDEVLNKIEGLSFFRMEMLPIAVQKEHEACSNDISELQWHIKHRSMIAKKMREKRIKAEDINNQLKEEISEIQESIPLVHEKLQLEENILTKIEEIRRELVHESEMSAERQLKTQNKHDESNKKAEAERNHHKRELHNMNKVLSKTQKSLQHSIKEYSKMEEFKQRSEDKIRQNHQQISKLNSENEGKLREQNIYEGLVNELESKLKEVMFDNQRLVNSCDKNKQNLLEQEREQNDVISALKFSRDNLDQELTSLKRSNRQTEIEIDSIKESEEKCILDTEKSKDRILSTKTDIEEADKSFDEAIQEFSTEEKKHSSVKQRLSRKMKEVQEIEDKLRKTLSEIESQIKQEIMTKTSVKSKMTTDSLDLESSKKESLEKQKQMKKLLKEAQSLVKEIKDKVSIIDGKHQQSAQELQSLRVENDKILADAERMRLEKTNYINELTPSYTDLKVKLDVLIQKEEHVQWQIQTMNSQLFEMESSERLISNAKKKIQEILLNLEQEYNAQSLELEMLRKSEDKLSNVMSQIESQSTRMRNNHTKYLSERQAAMVLAKESFEESLITNANLAKTYRSLQTDIYSMQDAYLDVMQDHLWSKENIKDIKEIQRLQRHMHNCMDAFFTVKLMYDEDQHIDLERQCDRSVNKIERLKIKYKERIEEMKKFLLETFPKESQLLDLEY